VAFWYAGRMLSIAQAASRLTRAAACAAVIAEKLTGLGVFIPTFFLVYVASQPQNLCAGLDLMCSCAAGRTYGGAWMPVLS